MKVAEFRDYEIKRLWGNIEFDWGFITDIDEKVLLRVVYGPNSVEGRKQVWDEIVNIKIGVNALAIMLGDFNEDFGCLVYTSEVKKMVNEEWHNVEGRTVIEKMVNLKPKLREWNKKRFGNIKERIKSLEAEIEKVEINLYNEVNVEENESRRKMMKSELFFGLVNPREHPVGYNLGFINKTWEMMGDEFKKTVKEFFVFREMPRE
ncbi:hypothetical protein PIB30_060686, partial [Stylosanthes scabra]|nr:hypothetical protein [Stylosanthes scabra]